jgi:hypothetical protein
VTIDPSPYSAEVPKHRSFSRRPTSPAHARSLEAALFRSESSIRARMPMTRPSLTSRAPRPRSIPRSSTSRGRKCALLFQAASAAGRSRSGTLSRQVLPHRC